MATRDQNNHDIQLKRKLDLMLLVTKQLIDDKAELVEEIKQLNAAVHIYREIVGRGDHMRGAV